MNADDEGDDDDVSLLSHDNEAGTIARQRSRAESLTSFARHFIEDRCKFAFNLGLFLSLILLVLEGIYTYDPSVFEQLVLYLYSIRFIYYTILLLASIAGMSIILKSMPAQVRRKSQLIF